MGKRRKKTRSLNDVLVNSVDHHHHHQLPITESGNDIGACVHNEKKANNNNDVMLVEGLESTASCPAVSVPPCKDSKLVGENDYGERSKMDSFTFHIHLEDIWGSFPEEKRAAFDHLDSTYFYVCRNKQTHVLDRLIKKDIFSKKYVFVPIVCWDHWRLVIFCHFGETLNSKRRSRCILLLDSTEMSANLIEPDLRKFVYEVFTAHGRPEGKDVVHRIPLLIPKVPQQTNGVDCGRFVLYFIKKFMEDAPENFSHSNGYPYFMTRDWFDVDSFVKFCDKLDEKSVALNQGTERNPRRRSQRIQSSTSCARKPSQQPKLVPRQTMVRRPVELIVVDGSESSSEENESAC